MSAIDCLILGFYDYMFPEYVALVKRLGEHSGAYRDLALAFIEHEGKPERALETLTRLHYESRAAPARPFNNADFLWPVVTYLVTYLTRRGFSVDYINLPHFALDVLERKLRANEVETVAITTTLYVSSHPILDLVSFVRRHSPKTRIIVGGPYIGNQVKALPRADLTNLLRYLKADIYVLCQEGEATLAAVLRALKANAPLDFVPNLAIAQPSGGFAYTPDAPEENHLVDNMVDYSLFSPAEMGEFVTIRTAKSCPFSCAFCGFPARAGDYTYLSVSDVEKELNAIAERGTVTTVTVIDDTFNVPKGRFKDLLRMMIRNGYTFKWNCFYRSDHGDEETIELMGKAGCEGVFLGVESGSDAMLERMKKNARRRHYAKAIPLLKAAGISTHAALIVGFPGETDESVRASISLIEEAQPDFYRPQLWYADPVTPIWKEREAYGIEGSGFDWRHNTMDAERASQWVEEMFPKIGTSVWLPQFGFEFWSTFYLQRKGMVREQVRSFAAAFNDIIKARLVSPGVAPTPELLRALKESCQFEDRAPAAEARPIQWPTYAS